jgi:hypothetical protein
MVWREGSRSPLMYKVVVDEMKLIELKRGEEKELKTRLQSSFVHSVINI